jgi:hypothetical protein
MLYISIDGLGFYAYSSNFSAIQISMKKIEEKANLNF